MRSSRVLSTTVGRLALRIGVVLVFLMIAALRAASLVPSTSSGVPLSPANHDSAPPTVTQAAPSNAPVAPPLGPVDAATPAPPTAEPAKGMLTLLGPSDGTPTERAPLPTPSEGAQAVRLLIPSAQVDAPIETLGITADRTMEEPTTRNAVAWYNFSARPGFGDPAVFAGHVDWHGEASAVFAHLRDLDVNDSILIQLSDGMMLRYRVTQSNAVAGTTPLLAVIGPRRGEPIILITCEGAFDRSTQQYDQRRIVRAERVRL